MDFDMKVIDKGLQGKGHSVAFVKLAGDDGSSLKLILDSRSQLAAFELEEELTVRLCQEQRKIEDFADEERNKLRTEKEEIIEDA